MVSRSNGEAGSSRQLVQPFQGRFWKFGFLSLLIITTILSALPLRPTIAIQSKPATDWSFYITVISLSTAYTLGCNQGNHDRTHFKNSEVILDFGGQTFSGSTPGTRLIGSGAFVSHTTIQNYAKEFARGYWTCVASSRSVRIGIGTNNSLSRVDYGGGRDWARVVDNVRSHVNSNGWASRVIVYGANDMEPDWASASGTIDWVNGFDFQSSAFTVNYGSADGCPQTSATNGSCNNGWRQSDLWWISWGAPAARALPEIYYLPLAKQWAMISLYGSIYQGKRILFDGPLDNNHFVPSSNTSQQAWDQLWTEINRDSRTASSLSFSAQVHNSN